MYINAQGEYVTDLAYQVPLDQLAQNPFDEASILQSAQAGDVSDMFGGGGGDVQGLELGSNDFMSGGKVVYDTRVGLIILFVLYTLHKVSQCQLV